MLNYANSVAQGAKLPADFGLWIIDQRENIVIALMCGIRIRSN